MVKLRVISFLIIFLLIISISLPNQVGHAAATTLPNCRFGITTPTNVNSIDITPFRIGAVLNWSFIQPTSLPAGVDFINVLLLGDRCFDSNKNIVSCNSKKLLDHRSPYQKTLDYYEASVTAHPGMYWSIGNEPDTSRSVQDNLTAKEYANRYYKIATRIRALDPTAKLGFGSIVEMTPIRMRYLDRAWSQLVKLAGSQAAASGLIDFWTPHNFILNEIPGQWGSGVPLGFAGDHRDAVKIKKFSDTYNIKKFSSWVKNFRVWMKNKGEQNKPLWITEYGSLFPPIDPPGGPNFINVSDASTAAFMLKTFNFMLTATNANTGFPKDDNKLVQRWFWYSLNDYRYNYGGSLFDPSKTPPKITKVGTAFLKYTPKNNMDAKFHFSGNVVLRPDPMDKTKFLVDITINNAGNSSLQSPRVWVYQDSLNNPPYAQVDALPVPGCGGTTHETISIPYPPSPTSSSKIYLRLNLTSKYSQYPINDTVSFAVPSFP